MEKAAIPYQVLPVLLALLAVSELAAPAPAQDLPRLAPDIFSSQPIIPYRALEGGTGQSGVGSGKAPRIRLFRMETGFLSDPVGLDTDDDNPALLGDPAALPDASADGRLGLVLGVDNPFFDFQAPGDPGGVGYYKVYTQYQLLDSTSTCLSVGFQAFTPAGLEGDGLANGPTVVKPTLACSHEWEDGTAIHGFIGKPVPARAGWTDGLERGLNYGIAFQSPLVTQPGGCGRGLHMFIEALGNSHRQWSGTQPPVVNWEVIPGLHWQVRENWWLSSGVIVPLNTPKYDPGLLHITCSLRF